MPFYSPDLDSKTGYQIKRGGVATKKWSQNFKMSSISIRKAFPKKVRFYGDNYSSFG
jgi:hypothetical protein